MGGQRRDRGRPHDRGPGLTGALTAGPHRGPYAESPRPGSIRIVPPDDLPAPERDFGQESMLDRVQDALEDGSIWQPPAFPSIRSPKRRSGRTTSSDEMRNLRRRQHMARRLRAPAAKMGIRNRSTGGCRPGLTEDPNAKRAVMSIFDPATDCSDTKDVPCNNWLYFLRRDGRLHLSVAVRANDAIWGFSGINLFEWSVLQEIIAVSVDATLGDLTWLVGSMHVYERHYDVVEKILRHAFPQSPYHFGVSSLAITTPVDDLDRQLELGLPKMRQKRAIRATRSGSRRPVLRGRRPHAAAPQHGPQRRARRHRPRRPGAASTWRCARARASR